MAVMASGGGSNLQAIIDACAAGRIAAEVAVVISNNSGSGALQRARSVGIPAIHLSAVTEGGEGALDDAIRAALVAHEADLVALAGYMKKVGPRTLEAFAGRVLNIHPALLPDFGGKGMYGMKVHRAVIDSGATVTGATVHLADAHYDRGPILAQRTVEVLPGDDAAALAGRVLEAEHLLYVETIGRIASGEIELSRHR